MDQLSAMQAFVRVVQTGSFSAVAREQATSQATISKRVAALEEYLGAKLLTRSSRATSVTQVGANYYERCVAILGELEEADADARSLTASPKGILRISAPVIFGNIFIDPYVPEFLSIYPEIKIDLQLSDKFVDLISEGIDVAIRAKQLENSALIARPLLDNPRIVVATPGYLTAHGTPKHPHELDEHNCLLYSLESTPNIWNFNRSGKRLSVQVRGNFQSDNADSLIEALLNDVGIAILPIWLAVPHLNEGKLVHILTEFEPPAFPINAIYPQSRYVPLKVRCFVGFLKKKLDGHELLDR